MRLFYRIKYWWKHKKPHNSEPWSYEHKPIGRVTKMVRTEDGFLEVQGEIFDSKFLNELGREIDQITTIKLLKDIEIDRVDGRIICDQCGKEYRDHPEDPDCPWPTFVLLCDGRHGKV